MKKHMTMYNLSILVFITLLFTSFSCKKSEQQNSTNRKPTILILGGTPSTIEILNQIPDSIRKSYNVISFNRPGFGGTEISKMSKERLYELAIEAGLQENDYGIIGISGGAPLSILLADNFKIKNVGIISGMVSNEAYFQFADSTFTKDFFKPATESYEKFQKMVIGFPNLDAIVIQAGARSKEDALRASFNELNFILSKDLYESMEDKTMPIDWWHAKNDKNVAVESVELFLKDFKNSTLHTIPNANHEIDSRLYIEKIINEWKN